MKLSTVIFALGILAGGPALAHVDAQVSIARDGTMATIPSRFGPAKLQVAFSGLEDGAPAVSGIVLTLGEKRTHLPACVTDLIRSQDKMQVTASASWYHTLSTLPPYLSVGFDDPGSDPASGHVLLFNLRNGRLISMEELGSTGPALWRKPVDLAAHCPADTLEALLDIGPDAVVVVAAMPDGIDTIPPLYVFDEDSELNPGFFEPPRLDGGFLEEAWHGAYYGRNEGVGVRLVPYVGMDQQATMLGKDFDFRAEPGGLLLVQYVPLATECGQCAAITEAISDLIAAHPGMPVRWVQVRVPARIRETRRSS